MQPSIVWIFSAFLLLSACAGGEEAATPAVREAAPTYEELANATFQGVFDNPVTLQDGRWEGQPYVEGGASRPRAGLAESYYAAGDLDADQRIDAAVVIWQSGAGSGSFHYLAVAVRDGESIRNVDTMLIEDRPRLKDLRIEGKTIYLELIQHGPGEPACCPTQHAVRRWRLLGGRLAELAPEIMED